MNLRLNGALSVPGQDQNIISSLGMEYGVNTPVWRREVQTWGQEFHLCSFQACAPCTVHLAYQ